jgi:glycosyltransferase involved in cell wall biosynthesis
MKIIQKDMKLLNDSSDDLINISDGTPLVSVIMPTYNCGIYLKKAINSVLSQTMNNVEVIVINDASTDETLKILDNAFGSNEKVKVCSNLVNRNQGTSRNIGISRATGKYIFFLDADDWIENNTFEKMLSIAENNSADIVACGIKKVWDSGKQLVYHSNGFICTGGKEALCLFVKYQIGSIIWNKLYLRDFIINKKIYFPENHRKEDVVFTIRAINECNKIVYFKDCLYNYYQRPDSYVNSSPKKEHIVSFIRLYADLKLFLKSIEFQDEKLKTSLSKSIIENHFINDFVQTLSVYIESKNEWQEEFDRICYEELQEEGYLFSLYFINMMSVNDRDHSKINRIVSIILNSKIRQPIRKIWYAIRFKKIK